MRFQVIACSTDSHFCHLAWVNTPRKEGGLGPMNIPLLSDKNMAISRAYGVLEEDNGYPFRGMSVQIDDGIQRPIWSLYTVGTHTNVFQHALAI